MPYGQGCVAASYVATHKGEDHLCLKSGEYRETKGTKLMFKTLFANVQQQIANRRRYLAAIAEIDMLSPRDLVDMRADAAEMRYHAWCSIYGQPEA